MSKAKSEVKEKASVVIDAEQPKPPAGAITIARPALPSAPAPRPSMLNLTQEQRQLVKNTVGSGLSDTQFEWGMYVAQSLNLDPLKKQVHFIKRRKKKSGSDDYEEFLTIQVSIDGGRAIAARSGCYAPSERSPEFKYRDDERTHKPVLFSCTVWVKKFTPIDGSWHEYGATAVFDEFVPLERDGNSWKIGSMWEKMPHNQLEKCAEFKALKRGFPEELVNLNIEEEFHRLDAEIARESGGDPAAGEQKPASQERKQRERGTLKASREPNRGHDNEGYVDSGPNPNAAKPVAKEKEEKPLEQITVKVLEVKPLIKKLKADQIKENKELVAKKQPPKYEPQPYYLIKCEGDISMSVWDKHCFRAALHSKGKKCIFGISRNGQYINLGGVTEIGGEKFVRDPDMKDWIPERVLKQSTLPVQKQDDSLYSITGDVISFQDSNPSGKKLETSGTHQPMVAISLLDLENDRKHDPHATFVCIAPHLFDILKLAENERCTFTYLKRVEGTGILWQMIQDVQQVGDQKIENGKPVESGKPTVEDAFGGAPGNLWPE